MEELRLPILAVIKLVSLYDIINSNKLIRMTPVVKITCDRKSATTNTNKTLSWYDLNWAMIVRYDSNFTVAVYNGSSIVGQVSIDPGSLISIPANRDGLTEIKLQLANNGLSTGKVKILFDLKNEDSFPGGGTNHSVVFDPLNPQQSLAPQQYGESYSPQHGDEYQNNGFNQQQSGQFQYPDRVSTPIIFDPAIIHNNENLGFKITLFELDLHSVTKAHLLKTNSLSVNAACARWTETTK
eukprot:gene40387-49945_t